VFGPRRPADQTNRRYPPAEPGGGATDMMKSGSSSDGRQCGARILPVMIQQPGVVEIEGRPIPDPRAGQVLMRTRATLISHGTELTLRRSVAPRGAGWNASGCAGTLTPSRLPECGGSSRDRPRDRPLGAGKTRWQLSTPCSVLV
jgi:hypothetical protein